MSAAAPLAGEFKGLASVGPQAVSEMDDRLKVFVVLDAAAEQLGRPALTPGEISTVLRDAYGVHLPRQRIMGILKKAPPAVAPRKVEGREAFQLMAEGRAEVHDATGRTAAQFIDPARGFSGLRGAHDLLSGLGGQLSVCDPYTDSRTLDMLAECSQADSIRLMSQNVKSPDGIKQAAKAFHREHGVPLEVRRAQGGTLHDRYIVHRDGMLLSGTSLNGLGLKQSFIVELGDGLRSVVLPTFEANWRGAGPL